MRIACPLSSGNRLTSATSDPPLLRIGSISIGFVASNTSHTVSARRNNAAGVAAAKENVRLRSSLVRVALTALALSPGPVAGGDLGSTGGPSAARIGFCGISAEAAGISFDGGAGFGVSDAGDGFGAGSGLISILACWARGFDVGGTISADCRDAAGCSAGFPATAGAAATGAVATGACGASAADDCSAEGSSDFWKAPSPINVTSTADDSPSIF